MTALRIRRIEAMCAVALAAVAQSLTPLAHVLAAQAVDDGHQVHTASSPGHTMSMPGPVSGTNTQVCRLLDWKPTGTRSEDGARAELPPATDQVRIIHRAREHELAIEIGPVDLPAHSGHHDIPLSPEELTYIPFDAVVAGYRLEIVDAAGRPVPKMVLHHMDTARPAFRELFLPVAQRFLALSTDTPEKEYPGWLIGAPIYAGEPLLINVMLENPSDVTYRGVRARMVLRYSLRRPLLKVMPFHLDVAFPMGPKSFDLPPGHSVWTWEGRPAIGGRVVGIGGHLHRYATRLELRDVTDDRVLWDFEPPDEWSSSQSDEMRQTPAGLVRLGLGLALDPTHRYRITAVYDNPTGRTIPEGGMAKVAGVMVPDEEWPVTDSSYPLYRADLNYILGGQCADRVAGSSTERAPGRSAAHGP
jgi:hypothetical protein